MPSLLQFLVCFPITETEIKTVTIQLVHSHFTRSTHSRRNMHNINVDILEQFQICVCLGSLSALYHTIITPVTLNKFQMKM